MAKLRAALSAEAFATLHRISEQYRVDDIVTLVNDKMGIPAGTQGEVAYVGDKIEVRFYTEYGSRTITCRYDDITKAK